MSLTATIAIIGAVGTSLAGIVSAATRHKSVQAQAQADAQANPLTTLFSNPNVILILGLMSAAWIFKKK